MSLLVLEALAGSTSLCPAVERFLDASAASVLAASVVFFTAVPKNRLTTLLRTH